MFQHPEDPELGSRGAFAWSFEAVFFPPHEGGT